MRRGTEPNKRVQDGLKRYWLCSSCEGLVSRSETIFAKNLLQPYLEESGKIFRYSRWLIHFCTSLSWRVLRFYRDEKHLNGWDADALAHLDEAECVWRELLLGKRQHPGPYQQHMLPLDRIERARGKFPPNINRYLMRAIDMDVCRGGQTIFTYAKLGRFIVLGFAREPNSNHWRGAKVHANEGTIKPRKYIMPRPFAEYLNEKASRMAQLLESVSDRQHAKIEAAFSENISRYIGSDEYQAKLADLSIFGDDTFSKRGEPGDDEPA